MFIAIRILAEFPPDLHVSILRLLFTNTTQDSVQFNLKFWTFGFSNFTATDWNLIFYSEKPSRVVGNQTMNIEIQSHDFSYSRILQCDISSHVWSLLQRFAKEHSRRSSSVQRLAEAELVHHGAPCQAAQGLEPASSADGRHSRLRGVHHPAGQPPATSPMFTFLINRWSLGITDAFSANFSN